MATKNAFVHLCFDKKKSDWLKIIMSVFRSFESAL